MITFIFIFGLFIGFHLGLLFVAIFAINRD